MKVPAVIFGVLCGAFVGFVFGILGAMGLGLWSKWASPDDPSAGSVAIVVIATAPLGAMMGAPARWSLHRQTATAFSRDCFAAGDSVSGIAVHAKRASKL